jgi:CubicO group peptidase (beta-lactamase class C family)/peptidoglycan/LPS O-acetylase OafA/YrhL
MTAPTHPDPATTPAITHAPSVPTPGGRDRFVDGLKAVAIVRVVLWHTWSWAWLSWIPAMPAMFFASGSLLQDSLDRRGWWPTVTQRVRRLMLPFWAYSAACVATMFALGWRPVPRELLGWVVPLVDPVGDPTVPGLWIPLWYVRAYLWFVLGSAVLARLARRFGLGAVAGSSAAAVAAWWWSRGGGPLPAEVGDALAYAPFVLGGMWYRNRGAPSRAACAVLGIAAAVAAVWWWSQLGPVDGVVNRSYPLTVLVGAAGVGLALVYRERLAAVAAPGGRAGRMVDLIGRRALSIYLWQGFGLVAAQRLVDARMDPGPARAGASLAVVVSVTVAAVLVAGPLEDHAAWRRSTGRRRLRLALPGAALLAAALLLPVPGGPTEAVAAPLSGKAVVTRADEIRRSLEQPDAAPPAPVDPPAEASPPVGEPAPAAKPGDAAAAVAGAVDAWVARHPDLASRIGFGRLRGAVVTGSGELLSVSWAAGSPASVVPADGSVAGASVAGAPLAWWSMTKAATAVWLMRSVDSGAVRLEDPLSRWVPEVPDASRITLEQLARHTSGIPGELDRDFLTTAPDLALQDYRDRPGLAFEPGNGFEYSRTGYFLLALALERATGTPWRTAMEDLATRAGASVSFDEDTTPFDRITDPDRHGYRGGLWASGGILSTPADGARFFRWALVEGLSPASRARMAEFSADPGRWFYGIGLMPLCPCDRDGDRVRATRYGLDAATGFMVHDERSAATAMIAPDAWFDDEGPVPEFYELQSALLDAAG